MDVTLRALREEHLPAWTRLLAAVEAADHTGEHYSEADLAEEMANPGIELGKDIVGAFVGEELLGYFSVYPRGATPELHTISLEGAVRPDVRRRGLGTLLAAAMRERAVAAHAERHPELPALYSATGLADDESQAAVLRGIGLVPERWNFVMRVSLDAPPEVCPLPEGLELRPYRERYAEAMREAHNAAFTDHPIFTPWSEQMWRQWVTDSRAFRPDLSVVALDPARPGLVAAYVQINEYDGHYDATGRREAYVAKVGTRREYRGRRVAGSLLRHCLRTCHEAGYDEAALDVDSHNPSGALGVYEAAGFEVESRWAIYCLRLPAVVASAATRA